MAVNMTSHQNKMCLATNLTRAVIYVVAMSLYGENYSDPEV